MVSDVYMKDVDGNIGRRVSSDADKISGLLFDISAQKQFWEKGPGLALAEEFKDNVVELSSLEDAIAHGITKRTGTTSEDGSADLLAGVPYYHISQYFAKVGGQGRLFVMFADCSKNWNAILDMQKAAEGRIGQFGVWTEQYLWTLPDPMGEKYSLALVADLQGIAENMANNYFAPASILLCANSSKIKGQEEQIDNKVVLSKIPTCIGKNRYVSVLLSQSMDTEVKEMQGALASTTPVGTVGLALGSLVKVGVGESIGWVGKNDLAGAIQNIEMGFGDSSISGKVLKNATSYSALSSAEIEDLDNNGYVFLRKFAGMSGHYFFSKDQTCSDGDFCTIARNRAINKSRRLVRTALLPYVNSPVKVDPANGNISVAQATVYTNLITDALKAMESAGEISSVGTISVPLEQNILVTKELNVSYTLIPLGCAESIKVSEGLAISK